MKQAFHNLKRALSIAYALPCMKGEKEEIEKLNVGLKLLEIESIRLDKIKQLLSEVIEKTQQENNI